MIGKNLINDEHSIPIIITLDMKSFVKGYHANKDLWKPFINEELAIAMEPDNVVDKYAVCVKKNNLIGGHIPLGKDRRFAKMIFYFVRADRNAECKVITSGKEVNASALISGTKNMLQILCKNIQN